MFSGSYFGSTYEQQGSAVSYTYLVKIIDCIDGSGIRHTTHYATFVKYPDGELLSFQYENYIPGQPSAKRLKKVTSNTGYYLQFDYWDSVPGGLGRVETAAIYATADPATPLARLDYTSDGKQVTDLLGRTWSCSFDCGQTAACLPGPTRARRPCRARPRPP